MTPTSVHYGQAAEVVNKRNRVLQATFESNPRRFKNRQPAAQPVPEAAWINLPSKPLSQEDAQHQENDILNLH